ncbi:MAG: hypothetical protein JO112_10125 [Planctomycetes bacterium]|nr:hypothetical protein [Planctomycetota bacterium]
MTQSSYRIFYESRELANELGDPLLGTVEATSAEEAIQKAGQDPEIIRKALPCCSLWAVRVREEEKTLGHAQRSNHRS